MHHFFPNPIFYEHLDQPEDYTKTEEEYIIKMSNFVSAFNRLDDEKFDSLEKELKEEMEIKDSYNPFD